MIALFIIGPQDAAGGLLKRQADIAVLRGTSIQDATDFFNFVNSNLQTTKANSLSSRRIFRYIAEQDVDRERMRYFRPVKQNRSIHCVSSETDGYISVKRLSCYECEDTCSNDSITGPTTIVKMISECDSMSNTDATDDDIEDECVPHHQLVKRGSLVAVLTDENCDGYFLLKANRESYILN